MHLLAPNSITAAPVCIEWHEPSILRALTICWWGISSMARRTSRAAASAACCAASAAASSGVRTGAGFGFGLVFFGLAPGAAAAAPVPVPGAAEAAVAAPVPGAAADCAADAAVAAAAAAAPVARAGTATAAVPSACPVGDEPFGSAITSECVYERGGCRAHRERCALDANERGYAGFVLVIGRVRSAACCCDAKGRRGVAVQRTHSREQRRAVSVGCWTVVIR